MFPKLASPALGFAVSNLKKTELETETETETQLGEQVYLNLRLLTTHLHLDFIMKIINKSR